MQYRFWAVNNVCVCNLVYYIPDMHKFSQTLTQPLNPTSLNLFIIPTFIICGHVVVRGHVQLIYRYWLDWKFFHSINNNHNWESCRLSFQDSKLDLRYNFALGQKWKLKFFFFHLNSVEGILMTQSIFNLTISCIS